jgi:ATP-dependent Clp protease ATP-binding subunit ClpX
VQQALLKFIEGTIYPININGVATPFDTNNLLFIVGGAFVALANHVRIRLADTKTGLLTETELVKMATPEDFSKFGLIPEFVGRLPIIVSLEELSLEALIEILTVPKNAIANQYIKMFSLDGIELVYRRDALERVAEKAIEMKTGARGLRTILEKSMREIMYIVPSKKNVNKVTITRETVDNVGEPIFEYIESIGEVELKPLEPKTQRRRD